MKRKSIFTAVLAAGCALVFSGCTGCAGCNSNNQNVAALRSNWYSQTTVKGFQPSMIEEKQENFRAEEIVYRVSLEKAAAENAYFSVSYGDESTYTTSFYAKHFDYATLAHEDYRADYENAANDLPDGKITAYCYKTVYSVPEITFTFKADGKFEIFKDSSIVTESYFLSVNDLLRPLYSKQTIDFVSPARLNPADLSQCYGKVKREYVNQYAWWGNEVKTTVTIEDGDMAGGDAGVYTDVTLGESKNTIFDNTYLNVAVRSMNVSSNLAQVVSLFTNAGQGGKGWAEYAVQTSAALSLTAEERTEITTKLKDNGLYKSRPNLSEGEKDEVITSCVSVAYNGGDFSGGMQSMLFAAITNKDYNVGRATMLKMSATLAYNAGTVVFVLDNIKSTFYQGS